MSTVLVIKAHPKTEAVSNALTIGDRFIETYQQTHSQDQILVHDLYTEGVPEIDSSNLDSWKKLTNGVTYQELSKNEQILLSRQQQLQEQFIQADKYVFISPMYNLFLPNRLKMYLDLVIVSTKTWVEGEHGPEGTLHDKKAIHIQSSGGTYHHTDNVFMATLDMGDSYLKALLGQVGIKDYQGIYCEGNSHRDAEDMAANREIIAKEAEKAAKEF
ncbi:FMN-dependent NADH-azoreductase [Pediococcus ethanolidurans]|uniref:NAD(P)H-dependent oxidoreductase n=1 Tax=Pediococcus ethanolidurans TaxID=319653 RepID=UPI0029551139|nr:NAD(P)H-dependent oxidoreductase [Pediococcus ethanolidurans]MDV7719420.1 FMN-dependent NADH-azoreductase [Pediococcus ethanolidurans]